jgi:hypothetical protein
MKLPISYLCIKGIIRRLWHEGLFKARGRTAVKFPRAIIDNYARGTYNVILYSTLRRKIKNDKIIDCHLETKNVHSHYL